MTQIEGNGLRNDDGELMYVADREQICQATFKEHCQYPKCDCDRPLEVKGPWYPRPEPDDPTKPDVEYVTNSTHGGKVTCYKCSGFIVEGDVIPYLDHQHLNDFPKAHFHKDCYNGYEHYYGLDKPID